LKAEYRVIAQTTSEMTWLVRLFVECGITFPQPVTLHHDNKSAISIHKNLVFQDHTKHIEINYHVTRKKVLDCLIQLSSIHESGMSDPFAIGVV